MKTFFDIIKIIFAALLFACGLESFAAPQNIAPGGVSGIAVAVSALTGLNEGLLFLIFNIPLIIIGFIFLGKSTMLKTLISVVAVSVSADTLFAVLPHYGGDRITAAIFGGLLMGAGLGITYTAEATSGGMDIINRILNRKFPHISIGIYTLIADFIIIAAATAVFKELESALYAIITVFVASRIIDWFVYGGYEGVMLLIFSQKAKEIAEKFLQHGKGVTMLSGKGAYSESRTDVICCAVHKNEYYKLKRIAKETDNSSFMIITSAKEVLGEGFKEI